MSALRERISQLTGVHMLGYQAKEKHFRGLLEEFHLGTGEGALAQVGRGGSK